MVVDMDQNEIDLENVEVSTVTCEDERWYKVIYTIGMNSNDVFFVFQIAKARLWHLSKVCTYEERNAEAHSSYACEEANAK